jgi:hypothetical protein
VIVLTDLQNAITNLNPEIYEKRPYIPAVYQKEEEEEDPSTTPSGVPK